ncbi:MAG: prepilin-type N-terminal cleavage/methylation domain-containing protein [bacterium]
MQKLIIKKNTGFTQLVDFGNAISSRTKGASPKLTTGFTLVELMVSTSIFVIIMLMALGSLVVASDSSRKSESLRSAMDNVSFAMEDMSRSLRVGKDYSCVAAGSSVVLPVAANNDCTLSGNVGGGAIVFTPAGHLTARDTAYKRAGSGPYSLQKCDTVNNCIDLTSPDVDVQVLKFFVKGSDSADNTQPSVYIIMKGRVKVKDQYASFAIQTLASQRSAE